MIYMICDSSIQYLKILRGGVVFESLGSHDCWNINILLSMLFQYSHHMVSEQFGGGNE